MSTIPQESNITCLLTRASPLKAQRRFGSLKRLSWMSNLISSVRRSRKMNKSQSAVEDCQCELFFIMAFKLIHSCDRRLYLRCSSMLVLIELVLPRRRFFSAVIISLIWRATPRRRKAWREAICEAVSFKTTNNYFLDDCSLVRCFSQSLFTTWFSSAYRYHESIFFLFAWWINSVSVTFISRKVT